MTVLTKPSLIIKKTPLIEENRCTEEIINIRPIGLKYVPSKRYKGAILCTGVIATLLLLMGMITAMQIYEQVMNDVQRHSRFKGFCSVPLPRDLQGLEQRKSALRWSSIESPGRNEPEIQVVSFVDEDPSETIMDTLREELDIDIDNSVEKISVFNNGRPVKFVHDFDTNQTGIVDSERCFTMPMDGSLVLQPELFVLGLQRGEEFDISRMRSILKAVLRQVVAAKSAALKGHCVGKPIYPLEKDDSVNIRKRSVDAPPHDYLQFAGNRIQEIEISNLAEVLDYEQKNKLQT